jgi:hypothetical protein
MNESNNQIAKNKAGADMYLPTTKDDAWKMSESFSKSAFCPAAYRGKPADVYLAMAYGAQIGLNPLLAIQNIAVVNGKPSVYGDALTAIAQGHHETEEYEDGYKDDGSAYCKIVRKGRTIYREFSEADAKRAGLWGRNTWAQYPGRMLLWRARGWAIRDAFADVLMGLWSAEEAMDVPSEGEKSSQAERKEKSKNKADVLKSKLKGSRKSDDVEDAQESDDPSGKTETQEGPVSAGELPL